MNYDSPKQLPQQQQQPDEDNFAIDLVKVLLFGTLGCFGVYTAFIIAGTIFDQFLDGDLKLIAAAVLAIAIPVLTALGENSQKESGKTARGPLERTARVFIGVSIFSFMTAILLSLTMPGNICGQLRTNPNWFLKKDDRLYGPPTAFEDLNRRYSIVLSDLIEQATRPLGLYEDRTYRAELVPTQPDGACVAWDVEMASGRLLDRAIGA
ncbi:MAG: hypothetical protein H0U74_08635 [Bradymonadaceae bacterium]|nr:hypothetical protein [Lujinxingiaceae bacterium]